MRRTINEILGTGTVSFSKHALDELAKDHLSTVEATGVLRRGIIEPGEWENGSWRYQVRLTTMTVVVAFRSETRLVVVTAWRNQ